MINKLAKSLLGIAALTTLGGCVVHENPGHVPPGHLKRGHYYGDGHNHGYQDNDRYRYEYDRPTHCPPGHAKKHWC